MKRIILLSYVLIMGINANAQKKQNVYFFKNDGKEVTVKDSADYIRVIQEPDSGEVNFNILEVYKNGNRKTLGKVSEFIPDVVYEGMVLRFNNAGKRTSAIIYENGKSKMSYIYYNNGKLHKQIEWLSAAPNVDLISSESGSKLIYLADSLGVEQVKDGNGHVKKITHNDKSEQIEEGDYKDGVKHGVWKGSETQVGSSFVESYEMGKFISGESTRADKKYPYTAVTNPPQFKGGNNEFYKYLSHKIQYPTDAAGNKLTGTIFLSFTVEEDGSAGELEVKNSGYSSVDNMVKSVMKSSPKWLPATFRGFPIRVRYSCPIKFWMRD